MKKVILQITYEESKDEVNIDISSENMNSLEERGALNLLKAHLIEEY